MEKKKTANKKVIVFSLIALALLVLVSTSYAYFTATITGNDTAKKTTVTTGTMGLRLHGNTQVGMSSAMPGDSTTITFSVENTGTLDTTYALKMEDVENTFVDKNDLVYVLKKGDTIIKEETVLPSPISKTTVLLPVVEIAAGTTDSYTMIITFKETNDEQNDNQNKTFTGRIQIGEATDKMLAINLINNSNVKTTTPDFANYPNEANTGLFTAEDDEGTSYYFRGNIDNNYVDIGTTYSEDEERYVMGLHGTTGLLTISRTQSAAEDECNHDYSGFYGYASAEACIADIQHYSVAAGDAMLWRVVRINGDGTVRLISDDIVGRTEFNTSGDRKYVGYTYDNGTPSTIKTYLDNWYEMNIVNKGLDSLIQTSTYCNDTSISSTSGSTYYYGAHDRIKNNTPQLICNATEQTYGGKYALKVGLISADELMMAGYKYYNANAYQQTYIYYPDEFWTGSPGNDYIHSQSVFCISRDDPAHYSFYDGFYTVDFDNIAVRPVINLKADILFSSGDGTKENPYVIG